MAMARGLGLCEPWLDNGHMSHIKPPPGTHVCPWCTRHTCAPVVYACSHPAHMRARGVCMQPSSIMDGQLSLVFNCYLNLP